MPERTALDIDEDITVARTPEGAFYTDPAWFARVRERVLARSWAFAGDEDDVRTPGSVMPVSVHGGCPDDPLLITRDAEDRLHCVSNVCTHRGMRLVEHPASSVRCITCPYHARRFELDGRFRSMPEFEGAKGFPRAEDDLRAAPIGRWRRFLFVALEAPDPLEMLTAEMERRVGFLPVDRARLDASRVREYHVRANWALYVENYLEGFHIPFVHASLAEAIDYGQYTTELFPRSVLQVGVASGGEDALELPAGHPDEGRAIAAWYFWLYPATMFNVYAWGISVNVVEPVSHERTRVRFLPYVWDESRMDSGAGSDLDRVEREDEAIVEAVQRSIGSRLYRRGRYSPARETGVHHFHRMLDGALSSG